MGFLCQPNLPPTSGTSNDPNPIARRYGARGAPDERAEFCIADPSGNCLGIAAWRVKRI